jgi:hypothetical protein
MTDAPSTATPDPGLLSRAVGVVVSPGETFKAVVVHPRPAGILLLVCVVMGVALGLPQFTEAGRQAALDAQVEQMERFTGPLPADAYNAMEARSQYNGYLTVVSMFVFLPIMTMLFGALYWFFFNVILGGTATYKQVLGVVAHAGVITALGAAVGAPIQYLQGTYSNAGPFNLGALVPMVESGTFISNFLGAISFFQLWQFVVTAIGLGVLYRRKAGNIAIGLILAFLVVVAVFTVVTSSFASR